MSSFLPSSSSPSQANAGSSMGTLQRSTVNNAAADALRKKMQQLRDELEQVKDDLERSRKELEKERHGREVVSLVDFDKFLF
jgi:molecular chaperone GrpE (heat shock protein)